MNAYDRPCAAAKPCFVCFSTTGTFALALVSNKNHNTTTQQHQKPQHNNTTTQQNGIGEDNIGNKMLQSMGWTAGQGLGSKAQVYFQVIESLLVLLSIFVRCFSPSRSLFIAHSIRKSR
jgi:hypothetical protein